MNILSKIVNPYSCIIGLDVLIGITDICDTCDKTVHLLLYGAFIVSNSLRMTLIRNAYQSHQKLTYLLNVYQNIEHSYRSFEWSSIQK